MSDQKINNNGSAADAYLVRASDLKTFTSDGAVLLKSVFDAHWVECLRESADQSLKMSDKYFWRQMVWQKDETCREFCINSLASALAAAFLDSEKVNLLYDQVFAKTGGDPATPWHNDLPYWPVRNGRALTIWLALDPINFGSGPLEFIAGSHLWDKWFQPFTTTIDGSQTKFYDGTESLFEPLPDFESDRSRYRILCWEMEPGDVIVFDGLAVHCARPNVTNSVRRGYAVRYTGDNMTYLSNGEINPFLVNPQLKDGQTLDSDQFPVAHLAK